MDFWPAYAVGFMSGLLFGGIGAFVASAAFFAAEFRRRAGK